MTRYMLPALLALLSGCSTAYQETLVCDKHKECFTITHVEASVDEPRIITWRQHSKATPVYTKAAGVVVRNSRLESVISTVGPIVGPVTGGWVIGKMIGPSGHAVPKSVELKPSGPVNR